MYQEIKKPTDSEELLALVVEGFPVHVSEPSLQVGARLHQGGDVGVAGEKGRDVGVAGKKVLWVI